VNFHVLLQKIVVKHKHVLRASGLQQLVDVGQRAASPRTGTGWSQGLWLRGLSECREELCRRRMLLETTAKAAAAKAFVLLFKLVKTA
jgi:hypothetical protein